MGYRLHPRWAAAAARDDVRSSVLIETDEFPFPVRFDFVRWNDEDLGTRGFEYLGYAIESGPVSRDSVDGVDLDGFGPRPTSCAGSGKTSSTTPPWRSARSKHHGI